jgi:hypothetical protein
MTLVRNQKSSRMDDGVIDVHDSGNTRPRKAGKRLSHHVNYGCGRKSEGQASKEPFAAPFCGVSEP